MITELMSAAQVFGCERIPGEELLEYNFVKKALSWFFISCLQQPRSCVVTR